MSSSVSPSLQQSCNNNNISATDLRSTNITVTKINCDETNYFTSNEQTHSMPNDNKINNDSMTVISSENNLILKSENSKNQSEQNKLLNNNFQLVNPPGEVTDVGMLSPNTIDSDSEVAQIDFKVNFRPDKNGKKISDCPRPMSWEGELSDSEIGTMCIEDENHFSENKNHDFVENLTIKHRSGSTITLKNDTDNNLENLEQDHKHNFVSSTEGQEIIKNSTSFTRNSFHKNNSSANLTNISIRESILKSKSHTDLIQAFPNSSGVIMSGSAAGGGFSLHSTPSHSPLLSQRQHIAPTTNSSHRQWHIPSTPSPDSAVHSVYSVFSSPSQSPLTQRHQIPSSSLSRNNSDASHSSCCSYSSVSVSVSPTQQFSPTHSPIQGRHIGCQLQNNLATSHSNSNSLHQQIYKQHSDAAILDYKNIIYNSPPLSTASSNSLDVNNLATTDYESNYDEMFDDKTTIQHNNNAAAMALQQASQGISRQQLINSPCPICGDKISGFHYGIFSCESCKGFFKRTVQNRKNYVCLRGASCPVTITTRKKCPACRFDKCLQCGMKLEAIREDRTRGGRSTYQCSYSHSVSLLTNNVNSSANDFQNSSNNFNSQTPIKMEPNLYYPNNRNMPTTSQLSPATSSVNDFNCNSSNYGNNNKRLGVPTLLQEIMDVEHLWHYNELELMKLSSDGKLGSINKDQQTNSDDDKQSTASLSLNPLLASAAGSQADMEAVSNSSNPDFLANLCNIADHRLYKIVKWCKSLPLFKNISIDDQICLLINSWCELLLFSCCYRSISTPGEIRVSMGKSINLEQAKEIGLQSCIERMLNFTDHLRRLKVDRYEYVAMKVIVLLTSDTSDLRETEKVRASQEKALQALQAYTLAHYPDIPAKFGELLLRIPELQRTCQVGKEMLSIKSKEGEGGSFNLLMELLRGDH